MAHQRNNSTEVAWYSKSFPKLNELARTVLVDYAGIPEDQVESHVSKIVGFFFLTFHLQYFLLIICI